MVCGCDVDLLGFKLQSEAEVTIVYVRKSEEGLGLLNNEGCCRYLVQIFP